MEAAKLSAQAFAVPIIPTRTTIACDNVLLFSAFELEEMNTFDYVPLESTQIRILHLLPGEFEDHLEGYLLHKRFEPCDDLVPRYAALSYVWGEQSNPGLITILRECTSGINAPTSGQFEQQCSPSDRRSSLGTILIGRNLASALRHLRSNVASVFLWCDSICINQDDLTERAAQVVRMGSIYQHAASVVVWLGPERDDSRLAIAALFQIGQRVAVDLDRNAIGFVPTAESSYWNDSIELPLSPREITAIGKLFDRRWFKRLWVRQEVAASRFDPLVVIGFDSIHWSYLVQGHGCIQLKMLLSQSQRDPWPTYRESIMSFWSIARIAHSQWDMSSLLDMSTSCDCLDDRDRVYGLLGIIPDETRPQIWPDYTLNSKAVYKRLVLSLGKYKDLDILRFCATSQAPSWVPDLQNLAQNTSHWLAIYSWASGDLQGNITAMDEKTAQVDAVQFKVITRSSRVIADDLEDFEFISAVREVAIDFLGKDPSSWNTLSLSMLCEAMLGGKVYERTSMPDCPSLATAVSVIRILAEGKYNKGGAENISTIERLVIHKLREMLRGLCCYQLEDGSYGLGLRECRIGDSIWVILGCDIPLALRGCAQTRYCIIGPFFHAKCAYGDLLFGEMPEEWMLTFSGYVRVEFQHPVHGRQKDDPRVPSLNAPTGWKRSQGVAGQPYWVKDGDKSTTISRHPSLDSEFLKRRGVVVETIILI